YSTRRRTWLLFSVPRGLAGLWQPDVCGHTGGCRARVNVKGDIHHRAYARQTQSYLMYGACFAPDFLDDKAQRHGLGQCH
ncbi:mCG145977, partial [Mus musculus]